MGLLAIEGACVALFFLQLACRRDLPGYLAQNDLSPRLRRLWLGWMIAGGLVSLLGAAITARKAPRRPLVRALALALSPACALCFLPSLLTIDAWDGRELDFLLTAGVLVLAVIPLFRASGAAFAELFAETSLPRRIAPGLRALASKRLGRIVLFTAVAFTAIYFGFYTIRLHEKLQTTLVDLGLFDNLFWNARHGVPFYAPSASLRGHSYLAIHAEFLLYVLLPFYALAPRAETLLVLQAIITASAAIPLYFIAEKRLGPLAAAGLGIAYLLYPPLARPVFYDFHFLTLAAFFILCAALFLEQRRWASFWVFAVLAMMCREDVAVGLVGIGLGLAFSSYRPRTGMALVAVGGLYVFVVKFLVMTHFGGQSFVWLYKDLLPPEDGTFTGVLRTIASNPLYTIKALFVPEKLIYVLQILVPLAFVCVREPRLWFLFFPGIFVTLLTTGYGPVVRTEFQYVTHFVPYVFLATVGFFARRPGGRLDAPSMAALLLGTIVMTSQFGALQQHNFYSGFKKVDFSWAPEDGNRLRDLKDIALLIPHDASLAASEAEGAHLGNRKDLFALKDDIQGADYILFAPVRLGISRDTELVRDALKAKAYGVVAEKGDFALLERGYSPAGNADLLRKVP